jgi:hypothetical protein
VTADRRAIRTTPSAAALAATYEPSSPDAQAPRAGGEGLAIRPQTLHLTPHYRRLRDTILRPHLRLTESRYFWERWKARLGPDAAILIMEVRDRCNRALAASASGTGVLGGGYGAAASGAELNMSDSSGDACTVSANDLAAACGFSRVTLWRILQRDDVRRFIQVEHNYVYDRRLGKKRRTISTYRVLMEDPLVDEDEAHLQELLLASGTAATANSVGAAGAAPLAPAATAPSRDSASRFAGSVDGGRPTAHSETKAVDSSPPRLHFETAKSGSNSKPGNVEETISKERLGNARPARNVDIWRDYPEFAHHVEEAESLLGDTHSRGFYIKTLKRLHPGHIGIWQRALGMAREQQHIRRSRGALFTRLLRTFAGEAGVQI